MKKTIAASGAAVIAVAGLATVPMAAQAGGVDCTNSRGTCLVALPSTDLTPLEGVQFANAIDYYDMGNVALRSIRWKRWDSHKATGKAYVYADGKESEKRINFKFRSVRSGVGAGHFSKFKASGGLKSHFADTAWKVDRWKKKRK